MFTNMFKRSYLHLRTSQETSFDRSISSSGLTGPSKRSEWKQSERFDDKNKCNRNFLLLFSCTVCSLKLSVFQKSNAEKGD